MLVYVFIWKKMVFDLGTLIECVWTQIFSGVGRMLVTEGKWFQIWHWFMTGKKGALVSLTMLLPSSILLRNCSALLSSWVIQALAKAVGATAEQPPHFMRNVSAFASKMPLVSSVLESLHTYSLSQSPLSLMCYYSSHESHSAVI